MTAAVYARMTVVVACATILAFAAPAHAQYTNDYHYDDVEAFGVVGKPLDVTISRNMFGGPPPQSIFWNAANPPLFDGLTVQSDGVPSPYGGLKVSGTPTAAGFRVYPLDYYTYRVSGRGRFILVIFQTAEQRAAAQQYTDLMRANAGNLDYHYWAALRGYTIGIGAGDEGLALYSYFACIGDYHYTALTANYPDIAAFYYWYYRGIAFYYFYERHGDAATGVSQFLRYVSIANAAFFGRM